MPWAHHDSIAPAPSTGSSTLYETRLSYASAAAKDPEYVGVAPQGTPTSAAAWRVKRITYDVYGRTERVQQLADVVWDDPSSAGWS